MDPGVEKAAVRMCEAMAARDTGALEALFSEDMMLIHMTGMVQDRDGFLADLADGTLNYHGVEVVSVDGTSDGRTADVILRTITDATVYGGNRHKWRLESRIRMTNDGSGWIIRESRVSTF